MLAGNKDHVALIVSTRCCVPHPLCDACRKFYLAPRPLCSVRGSESSGDEFSENYSSLYTVKIRYLGKFVYTRYLTNHFVRERLLLTRARQRPLSFPKYHFKSELMNLKRLPIQIMKSSDQSNLKSHDNVLKVLSVG